MKRIKTRGAFNLSYPGTEPAPPLFCFMFLVTEVEQGRKVGRGQLSGGDVAQQLSIVEQQYPVGPLQGDSCISADHRYRPFITAFATYFLWP